jgi:hypothetical protein
MSKIVKKISDSLHEDVSVFTIIFRRLRVTCKKYDTSPFTTRAVYSTRSTTESETFKHANITLCYMQDFRFSQRCSSDLGFFWGLFCCVVWFITMLQEESFLLGHFDH